MLLQPIKPERSLEDVIARPELRMYFLVMYNLSPIQQGIQSLHACVEYSNVFGDTQLYKDWALKHKTVIVLNGGTSNNIEPGYVGSMERHMEALESIGVDYECFREPDCNNATTAISFIVNEPVYDLKKLMALSKPRREDYDIVMSVYLNDGYDMKFDTGETIRYTGKELKLHKFIEQFRLA